MKRHSLIACALLVLASCASLVLAEERAAVAAWSFDGSLADRSGRGNHAFAKSAAFAPGHSGQGLRCGQGPAVVPDSPELRPAPGLKIECWAKLDGLGATWQPLVIKDALSAPGSASGRKPFLFLSERGRWEPRVGEDGSQAGRVVSPHCRLMETDLD